MLEFIQLLKQRYQTVLAELDKKNPQYFEYQQRVEQLLHGEAFIRKGQLIESMPQFPLQIAVIGPTQAGKSSIVNLLLNTTLAGVSPLAGYTVHPHGYCHALSSDDCFGLQHYFGRFQCLDERMLSRNRFDCYSLANSDARSALMPACVCWDTPDFDSIDAADYREGVIRTIALADVLILVVSKEKYADQSVWEVMQTIEAFQQPTLICVNKLSEGSEAVVLDSLAQKWQQHRRDAVPEMVPLLFQKHGAMPIWPAAAEQSIFRLAQKVSHKKHSVYQQQLLNHYWPQWLEPVLAEHHAQRNWETLVDQSLSQAAKVYQRDYLDHPHHYETFQNALLNLLKLLEIPGIAKVISKTRRAMTWPVRKLFALGKARIQDNPGQEVKVLNQIGEHVMIQLADKLLEKAETESPPAGWWKETAGVLRQKKSGILQAYGLAIDDYHDHFEQDVDAAAHRLYYKLQEHPATLNSLRATRITTDAAALALAIQAGGIGIHDLVLTPMMLTVTSLLAESAIGSYMSRVEAELKQHQLNTVKKSLFDACLRHRLYALPEQSRAANRFNISEQLLSQAEQALKEKKHGLRLL
ncbi:MAG: GTPase [Methylomonas sp.]